MPKFVSDILAKAGLVVDGVVTFNNTATGQTPASNDNSTKLATTAWVRNFVTPYTLPIASDIVLGGIKVGSGLSIDGTTGVLSTVGGGAITSFRSEYIITATAGQTIFTVPGGYTPNKIDLFLNGVYLNDYTYTATDSSTVVLNDGALLDDKLTIFVYSTYYVGDSPSARTTTYFTATDNQTTFTVDYVLGQVDIFYNGSKLEPEEYTANNGTSIILTTPCNAGDKIEVVNWATGGGIAYTRTLTIDGVSYDLSADRTWNILPTGGAAGDILAKTSATNYDVTWIPNYTSQVQHYVKLGEAMTIGTAVYVSGTTGNAGTNMIVSKASNASEPTSSKTIGLLASSGAENDIVFVVTEGLVSGIDTSTATAGDPVWLGVNGQLIYGLLNKPNAPQHLVFIGVVTRVQQINGEIFVKVQNGFELHELHNVSALNPADGDMIKYVASTGLWTKIAATTTNITEGTNLYYTQARFDTAFAAKSTTNLAEGTNLYYTDSRARAAISVTGSGSYDSATGIITVTGGVTSVNTLTGAVTLTTTNIGEGTNLYYTTARVNSDFDTRLATKSTTNLAEGTNLYYTDARVGTYLTNNSYATQSYVSTQINNLVSGAPGLLDTLDELAAALGDDPNFATTVSTALSNRLRIDINTQGLTSTQQGYGRTNLGLGSLATLSSVDNGYITDVAYSKLTGVPSTFAPSAHTHPISDITGLQTALDGKQASLSGTGFVKISGSTISYDNSTYYLASNPNGYITGISFANVSAKPTTIAGYGITDSLVYTTSTYSNPSWITDLAWSKITGAPAFITGYTESDTLATVTGRGANTSTALSLGQVSTSNRLSVGASDQTYASVFVGGAITTGTSQYAFLADPQLAGTDNYALFANARIKANTAVTNTFGVYIPSAEKLSGATITNNYALYIANQTSGSSTNYSIYSSGGRNYFGDKVSIGSNTFFTVAQFLVNGGLSSGSSAIAQFNGFLRIRDQLIIHNDANTGLESYLQCTAANEISTLTFKPTTLNVTGSVITIGSWNSATTLQFQSANNSVGRINFYDGNDTEGVYIRNTGESYGGSLRFGARWDDDEDKIFFKLYQSSAGAGYDARFGINVDPTETFQVSSNGVTAGAPSKGWPVYDAELDTQARRFMFQTAGNNGIATAGYGGTVALVLGQYYDSRVVITPQSNGGASPGDQGTGHGKDLMIKGGTSDNGVGYKGGRLYLNGGMGYTAGGYNGNFGTVKIQTYGGVVNIGEITGETRRLNVAYSIGIRANLTGTEQEIIRMGNTGSGVNDGYIGLLDNGTTKVLLGANASRSGDNFINNGGNFGINTDVPSSKLEVFSGSTTADALTLSFTTGADNRSTGIFFKGGPYPYARIVGGTSSYGPDQGFIAFYTNYNPSGAASTSGYCLERVRINPNGSIVATGDITAFGSPSDARLKNIKEVIPNALTSILKLSGYRFDWKEVNHLTKIKEDMGVIAQEVEKVLPELARTNDDGTMSVRYQGLTAVLIEAVKELAAENNKLKEILERNNIQ